MASVMVLGPSFGNHIEPVTPAPAPVVPGRRSYSFKAVPTSPGGNVHLSLDPAVAAADALPINVYAFFVQPVSSVPVGEANIPDWYFASGSPNSSIHTGATAADGSLDLTVPNVKPSLQPYHVQVVLEYTT